MTYQQLVDSILSNFVSVHAPCQGADIEQWMRGRNHYIQNFLMRAYTQHLGVKELARLISEPNVDVDALGYTELSSLNTTRGWTPALKSMLMALLRYSINQQLPQVLLLGGSSPPLPVPCTPGFVWYGRPGPVVRFNLQESYLPKVGSSDPRFQQLSWGDVNVHFYGEECLDDFAEQGIYDLVYTEERRYMEVYAISSVHRHRDQDCEQGDVAPYIAAAIKNKALKWVRSPTNTGSDAPECLDSRS